MVRCTHPSIPVLLQQRLTTFAIKSSGKKGDEKGGTTGFGKLEN